MSNIALRPSYWASVSGGKDSLAMLLLILKNPDKYPLNGVVHFELEIDYPFIKNVTEYMEGECKKIGVPFVRIKPEYSWYDGYLKWGFPTIKARWCNSYKLSANKKLKQFLKESGMQIITYLGYCADEHNRYTKKNPNLYRFPLVEYGILESDILKWAKNEKLFNNFYKFNDRCGCMLCPLTARKTLAYLLKFYPEEYKLMIKLAHETEIRRETELGRPFSVWDKNPKYNTEYIDNIVHNKWLPKLLEQIKELM